MNFTPRSFAFLNSLVLKSFSPLSTRQRLSQLSPAVILHAIHLITRWYSLCLSSLSGGSQCLTSVVPVVYCWKNNRFYQRTLFLVKQSLRRLHVATTFSRRIVADCVVLSCQVTRKLKRATTFEFIAISASIIICQFLLILL